MLLSARGLAVLFVWIQHHSFMLFGLRHLFGLTLWMSTVLVPGLLLFYHSGLFCPLRHSYTSPLVPIFTIVPRFLSSYRLVSCAVLLACSGGYVFDKFVYQCIWGCICIDLNSILPYAHMIFNCHLVLDYIYTSELPLFFAPHIYHPHLY